MTREEAYDLMKDCVKEIQKRLVINLPNFQVRKYLCIHFRDDVYTSLTDLKF